MWKRDAPPISSEHYTFHLVSHRLPASITLIMIWHKAVLLHSRYTTCITQQNVDMDRVFGPQHCCTLIWCPGSSACRFAQVRTLRSGPSVGSGLPRTPCAPPPRPPPKEKTRSMAGCVAGRPPTQAWPGLGGVAARGRGTDRNGTMTRNEPGRGGLAARRRPETRGAGSAQRAGLGQQARGAGATRPHEAPRMRAQNRPHRACGGAMERCGWREDSREKGSTHSRAQGREREGRERERG
jgi:hypothetical protein